MADIKYNFFYDTKMEIQSVDICKHRYGKLMTYTEQTDGVHYEDSYLGVPVILGKNGVEKVIELELDEDDRVRFDESQQEVKETLKLLI